MTKVAVAAAAAVATKHQGHCLKRFAFIFPGQGSQSAGMGKGFADAFPEAKEMIEAAGETIGVDMAELLFKGDERLEQTRYTQPAILTVSAIAHRLFENELAVKPVYALGHSLGEFSALEAVGALAFTDAVSLVHQRGRWMQDACEGKAAGMMVTLGLDDAKAEAIAAEARTNGKQVWAANYNSDGQIVFAGAKADLASLEDAFKAAGAKRAMLLAMSVASHCPILEPAVMPLKEALADKLTGNFLAPVISNVTAKPYQSTSEALELLPAQLTAPVLYKHSIAAIRDEVDLFIEFGNGSVLKGLNRKITEKPTISVSDPAGLEAAIEALSQEG